jgi:hypothetical protein
MSGIFIVYTRYIPEILFCQYLTEIVMLEATEAAVRADAQVFAAAHS